MRKNIKQGIGRILITIKRVLTLEVVFNNVLSSNKFKKETRIAKENVCVLGISKL